nr:ribonuclease H [Tanacetum cinerariifolium]
MASEQSSSGRALNDMTPRTISSGIVRPSLSSTSFVPPSRNDWDLLFQPMFDELLNHPPSVVNQAAEVIAPIAEVIPQVDDDITGSPSLTIVDQDTPSPISTRLQLHEQALFCYYDAFLTSVEPRTCKEALTQACWIEVIYHFIKDQVENGVIELYFINTEYQLADLFTKALGRDSIEFLTNKLGMRSFMPETLKKLMNKKDE